MSKSKRKTRSDKFPHTLHSTGQYCKKIKGKIYYFGKDRRQALERYLEQAAFLHNGKTKMFKTINRNMTLRRLCSIYLQHQQAKASSAEITVRHYADQNSCLKKFMSFIGQHQCFDAYEFQSHLYLLQLNSNGGMNNAVPESSRRTPIACTIAAFKHLVHLFA